MFEFDADKSAANFAKHGIDFETAQALWFDDRRIVGPAISDEEVRSMVIGLIDNKLWAAAITYRGEAIRIISVRRARPKEVRQYEHQDD